MIRSHGLCQACRSKELTPKKKNRITSIKNSSKKKKLENPDLSGFFRLMLEELGSIRMSMTGKAIHFLQYVTSVTYFQKGYISRLPLAEII